jgi:hypothetical protein
LYDAAECGGGRGQSLHRFARSDVNRMRLDSVTGIAHGLRSGVQRLLVEVGQQDGLAESLATGDCDTDTASPDNDDNFPGHANSSSYCLKSWWVNASLTTNSI